MDLGSPTPTRDSEAVASPASPVSPASPGPEPERSYSLEPENPIHPILRGSNMERDSDSRPRRKSEVSSRTQSKQSILRERKRPRRPSSFRRLSSSRFEQVFGDIGLTNANPQDADNNITTNASENGPEKAGHTLRKRNRVNYASEQIEDEVVVPNSTYASARLSKRKLEDVGESDEIYASKSKRHYISSDPISPTTSRRRNPARKSSEVQVYKVDDLYEFDQDDHKPSENGNSTAPAADSNNNEHGIKASSSPMRSPISPSASRLRETPQFDQSNGHAHTTSNDPSPKSDRSCDVDAQSANSHAANTHDQQGSVDSQGLVLGAIDNVPPSSQPAMTPPPPSQLPTKQDESTSQAETKSKTDAPSKEKEGSEVRHGSPTVTEGAQLGESNTQPVTTRQSPRRANGVSQVAGQSANEVPNSSPASSSGSGSLRSSLRQRPGVGPSGLSRVQSAGLNLQLAPASRWSHLTPYIEGDYTWYPEIIVQPDEEDASDSQSQEDKDASKDSTNDNENKEAGQDSNDFDDNDNDNDANNESTNDAEDKYGNKDSNENDIDAPGEDMTQVPEMPDVPDMTLDVETSVLNTPTRGSPALDNLELVALNSMMLGGGEEPEDAETAESQEPVGKARHFKYRTLRSAEDYIAALEGHEKMPTQDLLDMVTHLHGSLVSWQDEWSGLGKMVDDHENSNRRRAADAKYESKTQNPNHHAQNYEEPEIGLKGYKLREKDNRITDVRYLQSQDRLQAASYGFEYDPHPSKIGRQNPETQQAGVTTRGRSLRNQPRQTVKATEADGVSGRRTRRSTVLFGQEASRNSTPAPASTRGRRRRNPNGNDDIEETPAQSQSAAGSSFNNNDAPSDADAAPAAGRRRRGPRAKATRSAEDLATPEASQTPAASQESPAKPRRGRPRTNATRVDEAETAQPSVEDEARPEPPKPEQPRRRLLTLKIPKSKNVSEQSSVISDNGESRPSTANSDVSSNTIESGYSFRPKRQKRFRDEPEESESTIQPPTKKRAIKKTARALDQDSSDDENQNEAGSAPPQAPAPAPGGRKIPKIKVMRHQPTPAESRTGTPVSQTAMDGNDGDAKEYRAMTKSEKMSASMKNRWANGNMAGAVEKRKATLAAKKAAQAAVDQRVGPIAPKPKGGKVIKKEVTATPTLPADNLTYTQPQQHLQAQHEVGLDYVPQAAQPQQQQQHAQHPMQQQQQHHHSSQLPVTTQQLPTPRQVYHPHQMYQQHDQQQMHIHEYQPQPQPPQQQLYHTQYNQHAPPPPPPPSHGYGQQQQQQRYPDVIMPLPMLQGLSSNDGPKNKRAKR